MNNENNNPENNNENNANNNYNDNVKSKDSIDNKDNYNNRNSISINNSTIVSNTNTNINISELKKKENKIKIDDEYLQYLIDNKGFNKSMFTLHPELENFNQNVYENENSIIENNNNAITNEEEDNSSSKYNNTISNKNENESYSSNDSESFSNSNSNQITNNKNKKNNKDKNKNNENDKNKNNKDANKDNKTNKTKNKDKDKDKDKDNKLRESVYGSIVDIKEKEKQLNFSKCMNRNIKRINLRSNEFVLEFLGNIEEKLHINFADNLQAKLLKTNGMEEENLTNSDEKDEEQSSNSNEESEKEEEGGIKIKKVFESPNKILPDEAFKFDLIFNYFHFQICRRFYKPNFLNDNALHQDDDLINKLSEEEQNNIFELVSKYFTYDNRNNIVKYDMGKKLGILLIANMRLYNKEIMKSTKLLKYKKENLYLFFFPKKILAHSAFKNIAYGLENLIFLRMKSTISQNNLEQEFIKSCMDYKEFYSSIYENVYIDIINNDIVKINGINEDLDKIHLKYTNICINFEGITILDGKTYDKLMFFDFSDIVKIYLKNEYIIKINVFNENKKYPMELKLNLIFNYDDDCLNTSSRNRKKKGLRRNVNYNELDAYFLYEDIISLIQFNLLINTQTKTVNNQEEFDFVYQQKNKYQKFNDIVKLNENDIRRFKISKQNNDFYKFYKKSKVDKKDNNNNVKEDKSQESNEKEKAEPEKKSKILSNEELLNEIKKKNPKYALMDEMKKNKKSPNDNTARSRSRKKTNKSIISYNSSNSLAGDDNDVDDFFSDVKITNINDNIEKKKQLKRQEKMEKLKKKTIDIEQLLKDYEHPEDIMKELEEEQKRWEAKVNSSTSSFSIASSTNSKASQNKNDEYKIKLFEFNNLDTKNKKHIIVEKKLENVLDNAKMLLKDRDLVSSGRKEELLKERKEKGDIYSNVNKEDKSMSESSYLSYLSKNQRYPY